MSSLPIKWQDTTLSLPPRNDPIPPSNVWSSFDWKGMEEPTTRLVCAHGFTCHPRQVGEGVVCLQEFHTAIRKHRERASAIPSQLPQAFGNTTKTKNHGSRGWFPTAFTFNLLQRPALVPGEELDNRAPDRKFVAITDVVGLTSRC